jgi:hypothetical protein
MPHPTHQSYPLEWVIGAELIATASVEVCGRRPHDGGAADTGPAYANLQWRKPREVC